MFSVLNGFTFGQYGQKGWNLGLSGMVILFSRPWGTLGWLSTVAVLLRYIVVGIPFLPWLFWLGSRFSIEAGTESCWAILLARAFNWSQVREVFQGVCLFCAIFHDATVQTVFNETVPVWKGELGK